MNNGTRKGGALAAFQVLETSPGLEDLWQLHWSYNVGVEHNAPGVFIANIDTNETIAAMLSGQTRVGGAAAAAHAPAYWLKVAAQRDGAFTISNPRNGFSKTYRARN